MASFNGNSTPSHHYRIRSEAHLLSARSWLRPCTRSSITDTGEKESAVSGHGV